MPVDIQKKYREWYAEAKSHVENARIICLGCYMVRTVVDGKNHYEHAANCTEVAAMRKYAALAGISTVAEGEMGER
jgi:hypothetical protein